MAHSTLFAMVGLLLAVPMSSLARTWLITPGGTGDAPTIGAGVDSSAAGDTVLVACGTYHEHDIVMKSHVMIAGETPGCVVIDCQASGRAFLDNGTETVYFGLTIRSGDYSHRVGQRDLPLGARGAAVDTCLLAVEGLEVAGTGGGAILFGGGRATIEQCVFDGNRSAAGGAIYADFGTTLTVTDCLFRDNWSNGGSAIRGFHDVTLTLTRCVFENNRALWTPGGTGGAIACEHFNTVLMTGCVFRDNLARYSGAVHATGGTQVEIRGTLFVGNVAEVRGGALYSQNASACRVRHCTFWGNGASAAATFESMDSVVRGEGLIVGGSTGSAPTGCDGTGTVALTCSDVFGNSEGDWVGCLTGQNGVEGNFSADPLFCGPDVDDLHLQWGSPCLPENSAGCGLVGSLGFGGCSSIAVNRETWADIKGQFRPLR